MKNRLFGAFVCAIAMGMAFTACQKDSYADIYLGDNTKLFPAPLSADSLGLNYGYINEKGATVIDAKYRMASTFSDGMALVANIDNNGDAVYKFINKDGQELGSTFKRVPYGMFSSGLALVTVDGDNYKFINTDGQDVITLGKMGQSGCYYERVYPFCDGLAAFEDSLGFYGFMDKEGEIVIPAQFDDATLFSEGLAAVSMGSCTFFIDKKGKVVLSDVIMQYAQGGFIDGLCPIHDQNGETFLNRNGKKLPYYYDNIMPFVGNGLATAERGGKWGIINKKGEFTVEPQFDDMYIVNEDRCVFENNTDNKYGVCDKEGKIIVAADTYDDMNGNYHLGLVYAERSNDDGTRDFFYLDKDGKSVWSFHYDASKYVPSPAPARKAAKKVATEKFAKCPVNLGYTLGM